MCDNILKIKNLFQEYPHENRKGNVFFKVLKLLAENFPWDFRLESIQFLLIISNTGKLEEGAA